MAVPGTGLSGQIGFATETSYNSATPSVGRFWELNSESIQLKRTVKTGQGVRAGARFPEAARRTAVASEAGGDFEIDLPYKGLGLLFSHLIASAGNVPVIISGSAYKQIHTDGGTFNGRSGVLEIGRPQTDGTVTCWKYGGVKFSAWELSAAQNDIAKLKVTIDAASEALGGSVQAASYPSSAAFTFKDGALLAGGTVSTTSGLTTVAGGAAVAGVTSVSIKGSNPMATERFNLGGAGIKSEQLDNDFAAYTAAFGVEWNSTNSGLYTASYLAEANLALQLNFVGPAIVGGGGNYTFDITIPCIRIEDGLTPNVSGAGLVNSTLNATVHDDGTGTNPRIQGVIISTDTTI